MDNEKELPKRKRNRLENYDYSSCGAYFITVCTLERQNYFWENVGAIIDRPQDVELSTYGKMVDQAIQNIPSAYPALSLESYVIMPNHLHLLLRIPHQGSNGSSQAPNPTNGAVPKFISLLKRRCNRVWGRNIWQRSFYDHVVRNEKEYLRIWAYIDTNPAKWQDDRYYS